MIRKSTDLDISVVITAHREGLLAHRTLRSVRQSKTCAESLGVRSEILVVLDRPDSATRTYFDQQPDVRLYEVDFGDTGPSRNFGARQRAAGISIFLMPMIYSVAPGSGRLFKQPNRLSIPQSGVRNSR